MCVLGWMEREIDRVLLGWWGEGEIERCVY